MSRYSLTDVLAETDRFFALAAGIPVLRPGMRTCGCGSTQWVPRFWKWHQRPKSRTTPYRCDVGVKCSACAALYKHGVVICADWWQDKPYPADKQIDHHDLTPVQQQAVREAAT